MEAEVLKSKKQIKKGKLKKTMKNIICRPDTFWPQTSEVENKTLLIALDRLKVVIPDFKKPLWREISLIPKDLRPKPTPLPKVEGLIFGITECQKAIETKDCTGVLIEAGVNPKIIVQPLIETCSDKSIPVLCLKELRSVTKNNFGIPTSVLGVKKNCLPDLEKNIIEISKCHKAQKGPNPLDNDDKDYITINPKTKKTIDVENKMASPYLYRTDKKTRVFTPSLTEDTSSISNKFVGQNFIKLSNTVQKETTDSNKYMKMIVKKISSNPNRRKITQVSKKTS